MHFFQTLPYSWRQHYLLINPGSSRSPVTRHGISPHTTKPPIISLVPIDSVLSMLQKRKLLLIRSRAKIGTSAPYKQVELRLPCCIVSCPIMLRPCVACTTLVLLSTLARCVLARRRSSISMSQGKWQMANGCRAAPPNRALLLLRHRVPHMFLTCP